MFSVAEFGGNRTINGGIHIGVVKYDKRRIAAQFHGGFFDRTGTLGEQALAIWRRAGERDLAHPRVGRQHFAYRYRFRSSDDVDSTHGQAGFQCQIRGSKRGQRRGFSRFDHYRAARSQGWRALTGNHRQREVPGRNRGDHADRLAQHQQALVGAVAGQGFASHALGFFSKELNKRGAINHFALGFCQRLALL